MIVQNITIISVLNTFENTVYQHSENHIECEKWEIFPQSLLQFILDSKLVYEALSGWLSCLSHWGGWLADEIQLISAGLQNKKLLNSYLHATRKL